MFGARALRLLGAFMVVAAPLAAGVTLPGGAGADTFSVTNTDDSGSGSLRQAIADAAANPGDDVVEVSPTLAGSTITLTTGTIVWNGGGRITINGNGIILDAGGAPIALDDAGAGEVTIDRITITGAAGSASGDVAPVISRGGRITATNCVVTGNDVTSTDADAAGAFLNPDGGVSVSSCAITNNRGRTSASDRDAAGAVIVSGGQIAVTDSTVTGNSATAAGTNGDAAGALLLQGGSVVVVQSTISANTANAQGSAGGAILSLSGDPTLRDSTLNCNAATAVVTAGGGINASGNVVLNGTSVQGNTATAAEAQGQIRTPGTVSGSGNTISDNPGICAPPPPPPTPPVVTPTFTG